MTFCNDPSALLLNRVRVVWFMSNETLPWASSVQGFPAVLLSYDPHIAVS